MEDAILTVSNLTKSFDGKRVVNNVSFNVKRGDVYGFLGPNGAGKTTTIKMILGLLHSDKGEVIINGFNLKKDFNSAIRRVGAIVETPKFYDYLTGYQNLKLIANLHPDVDNDRIADVLNIVKLGKRSNERVKNYSLGMRQRLGIARALLNYPNLVILDEPTNGLDPQGILEIRRLINRLAEEKKIAFFISTHMLHEVEQICNQVTILKNGDIIAAGSVAQLLNRELEMVKIVIADNRVNRLVDELEKIDHVTSQKILADGVEVELPKDFSEKLITILVSRGINIKYVYPINPSLEEFFITITKGGEEIE